MTRTLRKGKAPETENGDKAVLVQMIAAAASVVVALIAAGATIYSTWGHNQSNGRPNDSGSASASKVSDSASADLSSAVSEASHAQFSAPSPDVNDPEAKIPDHSNDVGGDAGNKAPRQRSWNDLAVKEKIEVTANDLSKVMLAQRSWGSYTLYERIYHNDSALYVYLSLSNPDEVSDNSGGWSPSLRPEDYPRKPISAWLCQQGYSRALIDMGVPVYVKYEGDQMGYEIVACR